LGEATQFLVWQSAAVSLWADDYVPEVVDPSAGLMRIAEMLDVTRRRAVLTLVSHWLSGGVIELSDGVFAPKCVAEALPAGYHPGARSHDLSIDPAGGRGEEAIPTLKAALAALTKKM